MGITLHHKIYGSANKHLIVLHGLFGSSQNWATQCRALATDYSVHALDLRNHGQSPHCEPMNYSVMAEDIVRYIDEQHLQNVSILGHSMGGKVAIEVAIKYPHLLDKVIIVDITPKAYPPHHNEIFDALKTLNLATLATRSDADRQLEKAVKHRDVRSFLLKNLYRNEQGQFAWRFNLQILIDDYPDISLGPTHDGKFDGPTLFIKGGNSDFIQAGDEKIIRHYFSTAQFKLIQNAGHWPHTEKPTVFTHIVRQFLSHSSRKTEQI